MKFKQASEGPPDKKDLEFKGNEAISQVFQGKCARQEASFF
jgi:hypothetical protein